MPSRMGKARKVEDRAQGGSSSFGRICPLAQAVNCQPNRRWLHGKHLNQVRPAHWQHGEPVNAVARADPKAASVHSEEHEVGNIYIMGLAETHTLARAMHLGRSEEQWAEARRCALNCAM